MKIAIIGAGVAGLTTAKVMLQAGHEVDVFEQDAEVGGVWSRGRRYPGLTTQSPGAQYSFSDFAMDSSLPEWPTGEQVQHHLAAYAERFAVTPTIKLSTTVRSIEPISASRWRLTVSGREIPAGELQYDHVVVANGIFNDPLIPHLYGSEEYTAAGGVVLPATSFNDVEQARDRHVLVLGYGKTACDVSVAVSQTASSTDVVARQLLWKVPRRIGGVVNFKMLLLTRMGEGLFKYAHQRGMERFLHGPGNGVRRRMLNSLGDISVRQFGLQRLDLVPRGQMEDIIKGAIGLATDGFFDAVENGRIKVHRDTMVDRLTVKNGQPAAVLANGSVLPADVVVCATGFQQSVPFLSEDMQTRLFDDRGNFMLYRQIMPIDLPGLYFNGYNSSFFSPLNAEMAALWIAASIADQIDLPDVAERRALVERQLAFMDEAVDGHHSRGAKIIPFSMKNVDEVLTDLDAQIPRRVRALHWLNPVAPRAYRNVTQRVLNRLREHRDDTPVPDDEHSVTPQQLRSNERT